MRHLPSYSSAKRNVHGQTFGSCADRQDGRAARAIASQSLVKAQFHIVQVERAVDIVAAVEPEPAEILEAVVPERERVQRG